MKKSILLWLIAFILTVFTAIYQRMTGPTYPISGEAKIGGEVISYKLDRTHGGESDHPIEISIDDETIYGELIWKRYKTNDEWTSNAMVRIDEKLVAYLPHQPPAGKLIYHIILQKNQDAVTLPASGEVVIRFKGDVPIYFLIPHIIFIFGAMLLSTRTGLEYFSAKGGYASGVNEGNKFKPLTILTFIFVIIGGFIFGPIVQKYAFGAFWTGWPFGHDLTDNKTLVAFLAWVVAYLRLRKSNANRGWAIAASIILLLVYLIPHSMFGSELDYSTGDIRTGQ